MDDLLFGIKLYVFGVLVMLDICPFYWRLYFDHIVTEDGCHAYLVMIGPLFFEVLA